MSLAETTKSPFQVLDDSDTASFVGGLSRMQRYRMERAGQFPQRVRLTNNSARHGWLLGELEAWVKARAAARNAT